MEKIKCDKRERWILCADLNMAYLCIRWQSGYPNQNVKSKNGDDT